jgi:outer membrane biosynthesis protein TonB
VRFRQLLSLPAFLLPFLVALSAQESATVLPRVTDHAPIAYPAIARTAHVGGPVRLKITTDGHAVSSVAVIDGPPLLVMVATDNARTWKFVDHVPGTFEVTFDFEILADKTAFLQQPGVVDIAVLPPDENENNDNRLGYTPPKSWDLELNTATDTLKAPLTMWTYGPWLRGYTLGSRNQEREIGNAHMDGDMLGFESVLNDSHGQRLQFSLIGKQEGEGIKGIFLDVWGRSGTWTATPSKPPAPTCAAASTAAEQSIIPVPDISQHRRPDYPSLPREARIQGQVRMRVSTDSYCVAKITTESSEPLLAQAAEANVGTWWFGSHKPGTFNLTFNYRLLGPTVSFLEKPGVVEIWATPFSLGGPQSGLWNTGGYEDEIWNAQLTSPRGHAHVTFRFPYGCCEEGDVTDAKGGRKEEIKQGHNFGDQLGFSTTVRMRNSQPTRVSLIGRRLRGDRIQGVLLDESGRSGTWLAKITSRGPVGSVE